jgi:CubicO group peptidase (beta-lactamase class C family)
MNYAVEPSEAVGMSARRLERIRPAMQSYIDRGVYAGINTLIARRGKVVDAQQFGWRDKEAGSPMTPDTIFRLYSMTKPIVCVALMTLLEEGRFRLIDQLAKYIPAFGAVKVREDDGSLVNPARPVMLRDLMTHMSGLTYRFVDESPVGKMYEDAKLMNPSVRSKSPLTISRGFRWLSSRGRAGVTASASTSPPG